MKYIRLAPILIFLAVMVSPSLASEEKDDTTKVVYQCDFADPKRIHLMFNTLNNAVKHYHEHFIDFEINIVALGPCLQYMMKDFKGTGFAKKPYINHGGPTGLGVASRIKSLQLLGGDNIEMYACGNTMKKKNVKPEQISDYAKITPAGIIKIIDLQRDGYAYIKIK